MTGYTDHRLEGLEPDNLLAFIALLGLLRVLEAARPEWHPRAFWAVDQVPLRPALRVPQSVEKSAIVEAAAEGLAELKGYHDFGGAKGLELAPEAAAQRLRKAADTTSRYEADLWSALVSDAAISRDGKKAEPTPLCLMFGQGRQYFLERLESAPKQGTPRRKGQGSSDISEEDCLCEALFAPWQRLDDTTHSFRWDPHEYVAYALRARDPTKTKQTTQHGANRLAAMGLAALTVVPRRHFDDVRLSIIGGEREARGGFAFRWPIWREPMSLAGIRALLGHPGLDNRSTLSALGVVEVRRAKRISSGQFMNVTKAEANPIP